jgi:hypothetical protein
VATITQSQWIWTGWSGAPGYTSYYYDTTDPGELSTILAAEHTWHTLVASVLPTGVTLTPPANFRQVTDTSGVLVGIVPIGAPGASHVGASSQPYAAPAGLSVNWLTTTPATSRLVVGRSFYVPISSAAYQTDGTLLDSTKAAVQLGATAFVADTGGHLTIWRRPVSGAGGGQAPVVGARINDRVSMLRTRRS